MQCNTIDLGLVEYHRARKLQEEYAAEITNGTRPPTLLLLEHPNVYTFGRKGHAENLLWSEKKLAELGAAVYWVDRGGDVTYHGPGQLVGYPLIPLGKIDRLQPGMNLQNRDTPGSTRIPAGDYVGYIRKLEKTLILALARLGLAAGQMSGLTGVWIQPDVYSRCPRCRPEDRMKPAKIAAIGVKVDSRGITRHGFALNVNPDMSYWDGIIACGLGDYPVVSLADLFPAPPNSNLVKREIVQAFGEVFDFEMISAPGAI
jgi:lipoyl(octanoyl) transferase